ncbi:MAG: DUF2764 family protein [Victivallales bacterium]|nr:DUF2764 family protein [Victivallales bacterium]
MKHNSYSGKLRLRLFMTGAIGSLSFGMLDMAEYYYLVASLPMLSLGEASSISSDEFLESVGEHLQKALADELGELSLLPSEDASKESVAADWNCWETSMRNSIARLRAKGDFAQSERYERGAGEFFSEIEAGVQEAFAKSDPLERETLLDELRWRFCEDLELGHDFDIFKLAAYRLKLLLCEKRAAFSKEKGGENYDSIIESVYDNGR